MESRYPKSASGILGREYQVAHRLLVVASSFEMQSKFTRQFLFARVKKCLEPLRQEQMQSCLGSLGKPPI